MAHNADVVYTLKNSESFFQLQIKKMNSKLGSLFLTLLFTALLTSCQQTKTAATSADNTLANTSVASAKTPTEAYKNLYAAVKTKNTDAIKQTMSSTTREFAEAMAQMQKKTPEEMYKNGLIESTMTPNLPLLRDERVKDNFGAIEVQNPNGTWQDVPFVKEDGAWKLAVGELFKGTFESPGKPASQANANTSIPQMMPGPGGNTNSMGNVKVIPMDPKAASMMNANVAVKPGVANKSGNQ